METKGVLRLSYDIDRLHEDMLAAIPDSYQKTVGFPAYDLSRAFALAVQSLSEDLDHAESKMDVDNMTGDELTRWCWQRNGIARTSAVKATGIIKIVAGGGTVHVGDLFESGGGIQFAAVEEKTVSDGDAVAVEAVTAGASGNVAANSVTLMPVTLQGIVSVTNPAAMTGGYDAETDASLRSRYVAGLREPISSGNAAAYLKWALEVDGVGAAQVYPLANGDNTVEVCILGNDKKPAAETLIAAVQQHIDPDASGTGAGEAPMGAYCTVTTAAATTLAVSCTIVRAAGYDAETVQAHISAGIADYLAGIAFNSTYVSYGKIANAVNDAEGVLDYSGLTVNGGTANIPVEAKHVAVLGTVTIS